MQFEKHFYLARLVFGALLIGAYLHPFHIHPFRTYYHDGLVVFGVLVSFGMLALATRPRLHFPAIAWLPIAMILLLMLQMGLGMVQVEHIFFPMMYLLLAAMAIMVGVSWMELPGGAERICLVLSIAHLAAALLSVAMQCVQMSGIDMAPFVMTIARQMQLRPFANVAQPNQLALLLCFGIASVWWLYQAQRLRSNVAVFFVLVLSFGLSLTQSRIAWIILPLFALYCWPQRAGQRKVGKALLLFLLLVYISLVLGLPLLANWAGFAGGSVVERIGGRSERVVLMQQAWSMNMKHPLIGVGWFGFGAEQVRTAANFSASTYAEHAHNLILNFAAELGWPATLLICFVLGWWGWQTCTNPSAENSRPIGLASLCFIAVGVHSMVEFPLWYAYVLLPLALTMGMVHQLRWPSYGIAVPRIGLLLIAICGGLLLTVVTIDYQRVVAGFRALHAQQAGKSFEKEFLEPPSVTLFSDYYAYFRLASISPREGMSIQEIKFIENMSHRFGYVHVLNKLAEVYALNGETEKAQRVMLTLQKLHPFAYPEYFDFWKKQAQVDRRYRLVFSNMPKREAD